jgi:hypothetical protein
MFASAILQVGVLRIHKGAGVVGAGSVQAIDAFTFAGGELSLQGNMAIGSVNDVKATVTQSPTDTDVIAFGVVNGFFYFDASPPVTPSTPQPPLTIAPFVEWDVRLSKVTAAGGSFNVAGNTVGVAPLLVPKVECRRGAAVSLTGFVSMQSLNATDSCVFEAEALAVVNIDGVAIGRGGVVDGAGSITALGGLLWTGGEMRGKGSFATTSTTNAVWRPSEAEPLSLQRRYVNAGTVLWQAGVVDVRGDDGLFDNVGTLRVTTASVIMQCHGAKASSSSSSSSTDARVMNRGVIDVGTASTLVISDCDANYAGGATTSVGGRWCECSRDVSFVSSALCARKLTIKLHLYHTLQSTPHYRCSTTGKAAASPA